MALIDHLLRIAAHLPRTADTPPGAGVVPGCSVLRDRKTVQQCAGGRLEPGSEPHDVLDAGTAMPTFHLTEIRPVDADLVRGPLLTPAQLHARGPYALAVGAQGRVGGWLPVGLWHDEPSSSVPCTNGQSVNVLLPGDVLFFSHGSGSADSEENVKKYVLVLWAAALVLSGCGNDDSASGDATAAPTPTTTTTTAMPPISLAQEAQPYAEAVHQRVAPCFDNNGGVSAVHAISQQCAVAITSTVAALNEWYGRLHSGAPSARTRIQTHISNLEYWRDFCVPSQPNSPQRMSCVTFLPTNDIGISIMSAFSEDANRGR